MKELRGRKAPRIPVADPVARADALPSNPPTKAVACFRPPSLSRPNIAETPQPIQARCALHFVAAWTGRGVPAMPGREGDGDRKQVAGWTILAHPRPGQSISGLKGSGSQKQRGC